MTADPRDVEFWNQPLCEREDCYRGGPHFPGEYGCAASEVWRRPQGVPVDAPCPTTDAAAGATGTPSKERT